MRRIAPMLFKFVYDEPVNSAGVYSAYNRIFELARKRMELDNKSIGEYSSNHGRDGNVFNTRGRSQKDEGEVDHCLQNVPGGENTSNKVWRDLENKSKEVGGVTKKEGR